MRAFLLAIAAVVVLSVGAWAGLEQLGMSSARVYSAPDVRLDR